MTVSFAEIRARYEDAKLILANMHTEMLRDETYIHASATDLAKEVLKAYLSAFPADFALKVPGIAQFAVQVGVNNIMSGEPPDVNIMLREGRHYKPELAQKESDALRADFKGLLHTIATPSTENPLRDMVTKMIGLGLGVIAYPQASEAQWPDHPFLLRNGKTRKPRNAREEQQLLDWRLQRVGTLPWNVTSVHPTNFFFDPYNDPITWAIERKWVSGNQLRSMYPKLDLPYGGLGTVPDIELFTYVDKDVYCVWCHQQPIPLDGADADGIVPNPWKLIWYKMAWSGWGELDAQSRWEYKGKGIIRDNRASFEQYWTYLNVGEAIAAYAAFPNYWITHPNESLSELFAQRFRGGLGQKWITDAETRLNLVPKPELPNVFQWLMEQVLHNLEIGVGPEILRGEYRKDTLGGMQLRRDMALAPFEAPQINAQQAMASALLDMAKVLKYNLGSEDNILAKVAMGGAETYHLIDRERIPDLDMLLLTVNFKPLTKSDRLMTQEADRMNLELGAIDLHEYRMRQGIENGLEIDQRALEDSLMKHPALLELDAQIIAQAIQAEYPQVVSDVRESEIQQGAPPVTPVPNAPMPDMAGVPNMGEAPMGPMPQIGI